MPSIFIKATDSPGTITNSEGTNSKLFSITIWSASHWAKEVEQVKNIKPITKFNVSFISLKF